MEAQSSIFEGVNTGDTSLYQMTIRETEKTQVTVSEDKGWDITIDLTDFFNDHQDMGAGLH